MYIYIYIYSYIYTNNHLINMKVYIFLVYKAVHDSPLNHRDPSRPPLLTSHYT